jgi:ABC-type enterochelin transport system substrate-binding protein
MMGEMGKENEWQAISRQNPKLVINFGRKCPKTYPKLTEVQGPEVLTPGNFLSLLET